jgi:hypothetical protein
MEGQVIDQEGFPIHPSMLSDPAMRQGSNS